MPPSRQVVDRLWHYLCPSFTLAVAPASRSQLLCHAKKSRFLSPTIINPRFQSTARERPPYQWPNGHSPNSQNRLRFQLHWSHRPPDPDDHSSRTSAIIRLGTNAELHQELHRRANGGDLAWARYLVYTLVHSRGERPDSRHYYALILANTDLALGSVEDVERLVQEMKDQHVDIDSATHHAVLKALAIHPSYTLRAQTLQELKATWTPLTPAGHHYVIAGLLRDRQLELALESFHALQQHDITPEPWLLNLLLHTCLSVSAFPEATTLLHQRLALTTPTSPLPSAVWLHVLTSAAQALHHPLIAFTWDRAVATDYLNPPSGLCSLVLDSCSRAADPDLATDVFRVLGGRSSPVRPFHYEALLETYLGAGDLESALTVLNIMARTPQPPTDASARSLFLFLRDRADGRGGPSDALRVLRARAKSGERAPLCAVNAVLEALVWRGELGEALAAYRRLAFLVPDGARPNTHTFNLLLQGCSKAMTVAGSRTKDTNDGLEARVAQHHQPTAAVAAASSAAAAATARANVGGKPTALFLAAEMRALDVAPDALTYDRLVLICAKASGGGEGGAGGGPKSLDDAWRYFEEMRRAGSGEGRAKGWFLRRGTFAVLARKMAATGDER
ncbi:MAG: hypothetical protein LQ340_007651, partial [Diploschistes diacapsis]